MSAPLIWIFIPAAMALVVFLGRRLHQTVLFIAALVSLWLGWVAWALPFGEALTIGSFSVKIAESYTLLGRDFVLSEAERPYIALLYLLATLWLVGSYFARTSNFFPAFALMAVALLTAALAVEPFLYAALLIESVVLLAVPLLAEPGQRQRRGVLRFLAFQTFGMPFILFTGWMLAGVEASPGEIELVVRAGVLMAIGFAFLLAIFPFHSWVPMLAEEAPPYAAAFVFFILPAVVSLFGLGFIDRFVWLRESTVFYDLVRTVGVVMVVFGGLWAAFEDHLGRMMGYAVVMETGLSLLAISLGGSQGILLYFWLMLPRALALILWAVALSRLRALVGVNLRFSAVEGVGVNKPLYAVGLLLAQFSLAGVPLLVGFPPRWALWRSLAVEHPWIAATALAGSAGLLIGGMRTLAVLFTAPDLDDETLPTMEILDDADIPESRTRQLAAWGLFSGVLLIFLAIGLYPNYLFPLLYRLVGMFEQLGG